MRAKTLKRLLPSRWLAAEQVSEHAKRIAALEARVSDLEHRLRQETLVIRTAAAKLTDDLGRDLPRGK